MSYATEYLAEDFQAQRTALHKKYFALCDKLREAKEGTHEHEILTLKKDAIETEYRYLEKLISIQYHYGYLREHAEQMVRYFNGTH